jgi:hypothetical protein
LSNIESSVPAEGGIEVDEGGIGVGEGGGAVEEAARAAASSLDFFAYDLFVPQTQSQQQSKQSQRQPVTTTLDGINLSHHGDDDSSHSWETPSTHSGVVAVLEKWGFDTPKPSAVVDLLMATKPKPRSSSPLTSSSQRLTVDHDDQEGGSGGGGGGKKAATPLVPQSASSGMVEVAAGSMHAWMSELETKWREELPCEIDGAVFKVTPGVRDKKGFIGGSEGQSLFWNVLLFSRFSDCYSLLN